MSKTGMLHLSASILGLASVDGHRTAVMIPEGATVRIVSDPCTEDDRMIEVEWEGRVFAVFAVDLVARGKEVKSARGSA